MFAAIDILLERLKTEGVVDVFQTVRALRLQRPSMVQTIVSASMVGIPTLFPIAVLPPSQEQYEFCYRTVLEYLDSFELYANFK